MIITYKDNGIEVTEINATQEFLEQLVRDGKKIISLDSSQPPVAPDEPPAEPMTRDEVFELLSELGVFKVQVEYSGGGDEGGVDEVNFVMEAGTSEHPLQIADFDLSAKKQKALEEALTDYVWEEYGGYTGDGVYGQVIWNVSKRTIVDKCSIEEYIPQPEEDITAKVLRR